MMHCTTIFNGIRRDGIKIVQLALDETLIKYCSIYYKTANYAAFHPSRISKQFYNETTIFKWKQQQQ